MKSLFSNAQYVKDKQSNKTRHGFTEGGSQIDGLRVIAPLAANGQHLGSGSIVSLENNTFKLYDGRVRIIDGDVLRNEMATAKKRKQEIEDLMELFLTSGCDSLTIKYLGPFYSALYEYATVTDDGTDTPWIDIFTGYMTVDGYTADQAKKILLRIGFGNDKSTDKKLSETDSRVSTITSLNAFSSEYNIALQKMRVVIQYAGILITGSNHSENPTIPEGLKETIFDAKSFGNVKSKEEVNANTKRGI